MFNKKDSVLKFEIEDGNGFRHYSSSLNHGKVGSVTAPVCGLGKHVSLLAYAYAVAQRLRHCSDGSVPIWPVIWNLGDNSAIMYRLEDEDWAKVLNRGLSLHWVRLRISLRRSRY